MVIKTKLLNFSYKEHFKIQSLKNPYTGILSMFSTQIKNDNDINIFKDGISNFIDWVENQK